MGAETRNESEAVVSQVFGDELKRLRELRGLSGIKLAFMSGVNHSYVSRLELGARDPSRTTVESLADALDCDPDERAALLEAGGFLSGEPIDPLLRRLNTYVKRDYNDGLVAINVRRMVESMAMLLEDHAARKNGGYALDLGPSGGSAMMNMDDFRNRVIAAIADVSCDPGNPYGDTLGAELPEESQADVVADRVLDLVRECYAEIVEVYEVAWEIGLSVNLGKPVSLDDAHIELGRLVLLRMQAIQEDVLRMTPGSISDIS
jgi:transcriptional regulator with XRE-family HTH domain